MTKVLVVYGSRHGGTRGIAERIGEVLRTEGLEAQVADAGQAPAVGSADAVLVGSGVYMGSWLKEPLEFLERNHGTLSGRPLWLFSSGPLPGSTRSKAETVDAVTDALGPEDGPGSGGRKKLEALTAGMEVRGHRIFLGAFDPKDPPRAMSERLVRMMPAAKKMLPAGDFRDWAEIEAWAREIAVSLQAPVAAG
jgi:menaquinone-dependent protoporphyrinogen oxidase